MLDVEKKDRGCRCRLSWPVCRSCRYRSMWRCGLGLERSAPSLSGGKRSRCRCSIISPVRVECTWSGSSRVGCGRRRSVPAQRGSSPGLTAAGARKKAYRAKQPRQFGTRPSSPLVNQIANRDVTSAEFRPDTTASGERFSERCLFARAEGYRKDSSSLFRASALPTMNSRPRRITSRPSVTMLRRVSCSKCCYAASC